MGAVGLTIAGLEKGKGVLRVEVPQGFGVDGLAHAEEPESEGWVVVPDTGYIDGVGGEQEVAVDPPSELER